jgi:hypothetical protein
MTDNSSEFLVSGPSRINFGRRSVLRTLVLGTAVAVAIPLLQSRAMAQDDGGGEGRGGGEGGGGEGGGGEGGGEGGGGGGEGGGGGGEGGGGGGGGDGG